MAAPLFPPLAVTFHARPRSKVMTRIVFTLTRSAPLKIDWPFSSNTLYAPPALLGLMAEYTNKSSLIRRHTPSATHWYTSAGSYSTISSLFCFFATEYLLSRYITQNRLQQETTQHTHKYTDKTNKLQDTTLVVYVSRSQLSPVTEDCVAPPQWDLV